MPDLNDMDPIDREVLKPVLEGRDYEARVYEPGGAVVVLGRSRGEVEDVHTERCARDGVPVRRRAGGGGTVVLAKGMVVISLAGTTALPFRLREHMNAVNERVMVVLEALGVEELSLQGTSDIALGDRKIAGSSLYRTGDAVLYQGSLLVNVDFGVFDRYLKHPNKEPAYRKGRSHGEFLTSLHKSGYRLDIGLLTGSLREELASGPPWRSL